MRRLNFPFEHHHAWQPYPLHVVLLEPSQRCKAVMILVKSMPGGFVTANCSECNHKHFFTLEQFLDLQLERQCPECRKLMDRDSYSIESNNYVFICRHCQIYIRLADLLPSWKDVGLVKI